MKILLDECVTKKLRKHLNEFEVYTINDLGWRGKKNGELINLCIEHDFEIFLSIDKNLTYQQSLSGQLLIVVILNTSSSKIEELIKFLPGFKNQITAFKKGNAYLIDYP
jgi:predicted nuclease of predicted toxin-antitoxin system